MLDYSPSVMQNTQSSLYCPLILCTSWSSPSSGSPHPHPLITTVLPASGRWTFLDSTHDTQCWPVCGWLIFPGKTSSELTHSIGSDRMAWDDGCINQLDLITPHCKHISKHHVLTPVYIHLWFVNQNKSNLRQQTDFEKNSRAMREMIDRQIGRKTDRQTDRDNRDQMPQCHLLSWVKVNEFTYKIIIFAS